MIEKKFSLKAARGLAMKTQSQVAEQVGVTRETIARWESGKSCPSVLQGVALAECYHLPMSSIDFRKENQI